MIDESEEAYGTTTEQTGAGRPGATYEAGKLWQAAVAPVVIWLVIGILVSMIAEYALTSVYIVSHYGNELNQGGSFSQMMELMEKDGASIMDAVVKQMNAYSTPINGVRALIVIP